MKQIHYSLLNITLITNITKLTKAIKTEGVNSKGVVPKDIESLESKTKKEREQVKDLDSSAEKIAKEDRKKKMKRKESRNRNRITSLSW